MKLNLFLCFNKVYKFKKDKILDMQMNEFYQKMSKYNFSYEELLIVLGILLNKEVIKQTKIDLKLETNSYQESIIIDFAIFAYIFIGQEFNDLLSIKELDVPLKKQEKQLFIDALTNLIANYTRVFNLESALGDDNERANMFAINAILNIKSGIGLDNFHITLFALYQALELKLKHCLKKYIEVEPSAAKKQFNFHNLVRLIKLISTTRVEDEEMAQILKDLREYLRFFERINPGGQAARYEADVNSSYSYHTSISIVNEKEVLEQFIHALNLLQKLYLKLIELYDDQTKIKENDDELILKKIDPVFAQLINLDLTQGKSKITEKLRNVLDQQIFGDYEELKNLSYQELNTLRFLIRIGFIKYVNQAIEMILKK